MMIRIIFNIYLGYYILRFISILFMKFNIKFICNCIFNLTYRILYFGIFFKIIKIQKFNKLYNAYHHTLIFSFGSLVFIGVVIL